MKRLTHLITILALLSLGMGLSRALHYAVAHTTGDDAGAANHCASHCGAPAAASDSHDDAPQTPTHDESDCPVCVTLAGLKSSAPAPMARVVGHVPTIERADIPDQRIPRAAPLRTHRSRAPPTT